jgi:hypothetical protein
LDTISEHEKKDVVTYQVQQEGFLFCFVILFHQEFRRCMQFSLPLDGSYSYTFVYATTALVTVEEPLILQQPFQMTITQ